MPSGKTFIYKSSRAMITQNENDIPEYVEEIKTLKIKRNLRNNKKEFIIYELNRKQKPKKIKTISNGKGKKWKNYDSVINDISNNKYQINKQYKERYQLKDGRNTYLIQQNYPIRSKKGTKQIVAIIEIFDIKKGYSGIYTGYSYAYANLNLRKNKDDALSDCVNMAIGKFMSEYNYNFESGTGKDYKLIDGITYKVLDYRYLHRYYDDKKKV